MALRGPCKCEVGAGENVDLVPAASKASEGLPLGRCAIGVRAAFSGWSMTCATGAGITSTGALSGKQA